MRIALAQLNTTTGDIPGNLARIREAYARAQGDGADVLVVPELALLGYPPRDLLLRPGVIRMTRDATEALAHDTRGGPAIIAGTVGVNDAPTGAGLFNVAALLMDGRIVHEYAKQLLPTYDVFDEQRYFAPGEADAVVEIAGRRVGLLVCEDLWSTDLVLGRKRYAADPPAALKAAGVDLVISLSASPYHADKDEHRRTLFGGEARRMQAPLVSCQLVGGNDDVLFDGRSRVFAADGTERVRLKAFEADYRLVDMDALPTAPKLPDELPDAEETRRALVMGLADYSRKTGLRKALVGLSGGIDSAVVICLAADALGAERVLGVSMPGPFTTSGTKNDAQDIATRIGTDFKEIPIGPGYEALTGMLAEPFAGTPFGVTEENLQARIRGTVLMALSNKFGHLVLSTGNKSEVAVGYCTLYGDMNGGLAVISDVWKTHVYEIARIYEARGWLPSSVLTRPPSAELAPDQKDEDSLPPYDVLDRILERRIERARSLSEIVAAGEDEATVRRVLLLVERNEYKRRQMAPGLKVTPLAFGVGWRMPIARPVDLSGEN